MNSSSRTSQIAERQTYLLGTPVDTLLRVLRNNAFRGEAFRMFRSEHVYAKLLTQL